MLSGRYSALLLLRLEVGRGQDIMARVCASLPSVPSDRVGDGHVQFCTQPNRAASPKHSVARDSRTSEETSSSPRHVQQFRRWGVGSRAHRLTLEQPTELVPRRQVHGVSTGPKCRCGHCAACSALQAGRDGEGMRWYAAPAKKTEQAADSLERQPIMPYDSDENCSMGQGMAPFIPPPIQKLINMIMRHGKKETARRIVFDASHALYNATRNPNPRPELRQRHKDFTPE